MPHDPLDNKFENEQFAISLSHDAHANYNRYLANENFENNQLNEDTTRHSKYF